MERLVGVNRNIPQPSEVERLLTQAMKDIRTLGKFLDGKIAVLEARVSKLERG